jgi:hypothetical protein
MALSLKACPNCGKRGAQLISHHPLGSDYFCQVCLKLFVESREAITPTAKAKPANPDR